MRDNEKSVNDRKTYRWNIQKQIFSTKMETFHVKMGDLIMFCLPQFYYIKVGVKVVYIADNLTFRPNKGVH